MRTVVIALSALAFIGSAAPAGAQPGLPCGPFAAADSVPAPAARSDAHSIERLGEILKAVQSQPHRVLFLGDSLTERWDAAVWRENFLPRGGLNAGINGDRTEHLSWRLDHGNLDGPAPQAIVLWIGTNDLGHGRTPAVAAEGIRSVLLKLRSRLPGTPILLLGLPPRSERPDDALRRGVEQVNRLIAACGDGEAVVYADIGAPLLDPQGRLTASISPDRLHFSARGYALLAPSIDAQLDRLLARSR